MFTGIGKTDWQRAFQSDFSSGRIHDMHHFYIVSGWRSRRFSAPFRCAIAVKREELFRAIGEVDEELLDGAANFSGGHKRRRMLRAIT